MNEITKLVDPLTELRAELGRTPLQLEISGAATARAARDELSHQIDDYLLPRLRRLDAPLLVVIGGSTGSGKSTITNTIVGREVSAAGVLRPTTRSPVLICHPDDKPWFAGNDLLPDLARVTGPDHDPPSPSSDHRPTLRLVTAPSLGPGLAILDAPDIDSVEEANRDLATQLLAAADLWLFTTTAMRYADAVPWEFLHQARDRGTSLAVIINRVPPGTDGEIVPHLKAMLVERGLQGVAVYPIEQTELVTAGDGAGSTPGLLPAHSTAEIQGLLTALATDAEQRALVVRSTLHGALGSIGERSEAVLAAVRAEEEATGQLREAVDGSYNRAVERLKDDIASGNLLREEVLDRWQELVGTAELMQAIQSRISLIRDRVSAFLRGRPAATAEVQGEITSTLEQLLIDHADAAAAATADRWHDLPGGRRALDDQRQLQRSSEGFRGAVGAEIRAWQDDILDLVRERGAGKRTTARVLAFGINSVGIALMVVLFSQTAGISGGEIAIGAGTAGLSQTLLSALFGEQAVRELASEARGLLVDRIAKMFDVEADRFRHQLVQITGGHADGRPGPAALGDSDAPGPTSESESESGTGTESDDRPVNPSLGSERLRAALNAFRQAQ